LRFPFSSITDRLHWLNLPGNTREVPLLVLALHIAILAKLEHSTVPNLGTSKTKWGIRMPEQRRTLKEGVHRGF
jgi:hypothetical protein